jgi:hypothetical protein
VREFVHSLSDSYVAKHCALAQESYDIFWLFDGVALGSDRAEFFTTRNGSRAVCNMLKPRARQLAEQLGKEHVAAHYNNRLWTMGNDSRYWFHADTPVNQSLIQIFNNTCAKSQQAGWPAT